MHCIVPTIYGWFLFIELRLMHLYWTYSILIVKVVPSVAATHVVQMNLRLWVGVRGDVWDVGVVVLL